MFGRDIIAATSPRDKKPNSWLLVQHANARSYILKSIKIGIVSPTSCSQGLDSAELTEQMWPKGWIDAQIEASWAPKRCIWDWNLFSSLNLLLDFRSSCLRWDLQVHYNSSITNSKPMYICISHGRNLLRIHFHSQPGNSSLARSTVGMLVLLLLFKGALLKVQAIKYREASAMNSDAYTRILAGSLDS